MNDSDSYLPHLRIWLAARFSANFAKQMLYLIVGWHVYQLTHSPMALGLIGLAAALPYVACALWAGHLADHMERRFLILVSNLGLFTCAAGLCLFSWNGASMLWPIYFLIGLTGVFSSLEVSSSAYLQALVPKAEFPRAMAMNLTRFQGAIVAGPLLGGWVLSHYGATRAYGTAAFILVGTFALTARLKKVHPREVEEDGVGAIARIKSGLRFIRSQPAILGAMSMDLFAVLFADCVGLFPIFADRYGVGAAGLGVLRAAPAVGSVALSLVQTYRPFFTPNWRNLLKTIMIFGVCLIAFALSHNFIWGVLFLAIGGAADGVSVITRQSIYQDRTPDHLRGRVSSVSGIFIRTSNEIGEFESGVAASLIGVVPSVIVGASLTLLGAAFMFWKYPRLDE